MAFKNVIDPSSAAEKLARALDHHLPDISDAQVTHVELSEASGMSCETLLFDAEWSQDGEHRHERLVARVQPTGPGIYPRYDLGLEFSVMQALDTHTDIPVPGMYFHDSTGESLGTPFIVMRRAEGQAPSDDPPFTTGGWVCELSPDQQARLHDNALSTLVKIHAVDIDAIGLGNLREHPQAELDGQLAYWRDTFAWAAPGEANPTVEVALDWVERNRPDYTGTSVLNWGDARVGNIMYATDQAVTAVLDWEMLTYGPRELDLGWWLSMAKYYTDGIGVPAPPGFPDRDRLIERYEQLTGQKVQHLHYFEVLGALRLAILMHRAANLMIQAGQLPPDTTMKTSNPPTHILAHLLDLPAPVGQPQSFAGNR